MNKKIRCVRIKHRRHRARLKARERQRRQAGRKREG